MGKTALITGSFDPPTIGHYDLIKRVSTLFDRVIVCICINDAKQYMFSRLMRIEMLSAMCVGLSNVIVESNDGLTAYYAQKNDINVIVRGARTGADFEYEKNVHAVNNSLHPIETIILPAKPEHAHVSSSVVRELIKYSAPLDAYLTPEVIRVISNYRTITEIHKRKE